MAVFEAADGQNLILSLTYATDIRHMREQMMAKLRVGVLYGGRSAEHDVSVMSARNVVAVIDTGRYEIVPIGVTRAGAWVLSGYVDGVLGAVPAAGTHIALVPGGHGAMVALDGHPADLRPLDVLFPILHGPHGEDGTVQGYAEVAGVPYVGCGVLSSALAMDKDAAKRILRDAGLPVARAIVMSPGQSVDSEEVGKTLGWPVFIKPANQGSSFGISKVERAEQLAAAIELARQYDHTVLIEEFIEGREIECAVLEHPDGSLTVSSPGEIAPSDTHGFYTHEAKYYDPDGASIVVPAIVPAGAKNEVMRLSALAFRALFCRGLARVDFFLKRDGRLVLNEVNTMPGFANISMYPKALGASGMAYPTIVNTLIEAALTRKAMLNAALA